MIKGFRSKSLKTLWIKGDASGIRPEWRNRVILVLSALNSASKPDDLDLPGLGFHALTGNLSGRFALTVSRNWRVTFGWDDKNAIDVDLEDYHG